MQVQEIERLGIGLDLGIHDLALQRDLPADMEDRFLRIEKRRRRPRPDHDAVSLRRV